MSTPLLRMARLATPVWRWIALSALLGVVTVVSSMGLMGAAAFIIASAAFHPPLVDLQLAIVGVRFFGIARAVSRYGERLASHETTFRLLARIRVWFYRALEPLVPARLSQLAAGDVLGRAVSDVEELELFYVRVLAPPLVGATVTVATGVFIACFDLGMAVLTVGSMVAVGILLPLAVWSAGRAPGRRRIAARSALIRELVEGLQGSAELTAAGRVPERTARLEDAAAELAGAETRSAAIAGLETGITTLLTHLTIWGLLLVAIPSAASDRISGITVAVLLLVAMAAFEAVQPLSAAVQGLESQHRAAKRLYEILDARPAVLDPAHPAPLTWDGPTPSLELDDVCFRYTADAQPALEAVSFTIPPGGRMAVVGPSGAGKSTLVHLLLRFWDPDSGTVQVGGHDLRTVAQNDLRRTIGVVSQRTELLTGTIAEALRLALPDAKDDQLWAALETARLADTVCRLPEGLETWIGEHGLRLSEGQRQRLSVARMVLASPPVLLLDEPTANLDSVTARDLMRSLREAMQNRTTLLITHRLADAARMDEVLVLDDGRLVEHGRHDELLAGDGPYHRMWAIHRQTLG